MRASAFCVLFLLIPACKRETPSAGDSSTPLASGSAATDTASRSNAMTLKITSSAFQQGGSIPAKYTCEGQDVSPPLAWAGPPGSAMSIAMIVDDPDAPDPAKPQRVYVHWVAYNIPVNSSLGENASKSGMPKGAVQGKNDWGKPEYGGPCPPMGRHHYFFKIYALDTTLTGLSSGATKADLERAIKGHVVDSGELMGTYQKAKK